MAIFKPHLVTLIKLFYPNSIRYDTRKDQNVSPNTSATFLLRWLWTLVYDLDLQIWPRLCQDELSHQISIKIKGHFIRKLSY